MEQIFDFRGGKRKKRRTRPIFFLNLGGTTVSAVKIPDG